MSSRNVFDAEEFLETKWDRGISGLYILLGGLGLVMAVLYWGGWV